MLSSTGGDYRERSWEHVVAVGEVLFTGQDESLPCLERIRKNRLRERLYTVLNYEMAI